MRDLSSYRQDFPVLRRMVNGHPLVYLDTAATAQKPTAVIDVIHDFYGKDYGTVHRAVYSLSQGATDRYSQVREQIRHYIGAAKVEEIIFTKGTTDAINLVASSFGKAFISAGDEILVSEIEHHSNIVPWQLLCQERGALLRVIPVSDSGELLLDIYAQMLTDKTKLVALAHVSNVVGTINPVKQAIAMAHAVGAKVLLDGAQAAPHLSIDVQEIDADFYAFSGHKMYGPTGIGILYGKEALLEAMPPYAGGGDMIDKVSFKGTTYHELPLKFEAGTPSIASVMGLGAAVSYIEAIGRPAIQAWEHDLLMYATECLQAIPRVSILGSAEEKGALISFSVEGVHHLDLGCLLDGRGIAVRTGHLCTQPAMERFGITGITRASFGLYSSRGDVDSLADAVEYMARSYGG